jgi:CRP-like cAMP-binding protein
MGSVNLDYFIHAANILLLGAYSVRDILWLRLLAVASSLAAIPYFLLQPIPLWAAFGWSVLFTGINILQAWRLLVERRPVKLTAEEDEVRRMVFGDLPPRKVLQVLSIGSWVTAPPGERLIEGGKPVESISLLVHGTAQVAKDGQVLGQLGAGDLVGSALLMSGVVADIDALTVTPARLVRWEAATLERFLSANPETRNLFQRHLARDLAGKLVRLGTDLSSPRVSASS